MIRRVSRLILPGIVLGVGAVAIASNTPWLWSLYDEIYPGDPAKQQALQMCFLQNPQFNRLDSEARDHCYRQMQLIGAAQPLDATATATASARSAAPNFVDLRRSAAQGSMPRNDIRIIQQTHLAIGHEAHR